MNAPAAPRRPLAALALGTLAVAAADMAMAMSYWGLKGVAPTRILQGIAAALLGRERAVAGGLATAALGATMHLVLAALMVVGCWAWVRRWPALAARPIAAGLAWGLLTWAVMMLVVVPLSAIGGSTSTDPVWRALHLGSHLFIVGLPSVWLARRTLAAPP